MKKLILSLLVLLSANCTVNAQAPQGFNFQGIALDGNGYVVASKLVSLRFSVSTDSLGSAISYQESVSAQTDKYGQFITVIGSGNPSIGDFKSIPWATGNLFMKTEIDIEGTGTYITVGLSKLLSVPYALQANSASNITSDSLHNTRAGSGSLNSNPTGDSNTAIGFNSLLQNTTGGGNTGIGFESLVSNTVGSYNTANGFLSLRYNTTGHSNTANGAQSFEMNTTGSENTANGNGALQNNATGNTNTANGIVSLQSNTTGSENTANGGKALQNNRTGDKNTANGNQSLYSNTTGTNNTAIGYNSGGKLETGDKNIFIGNDAGNNDNFTSTSNKLVIQNDNSFTPLIYGEFDTKKLTINGKLMVGDSSATTPSAVLEANSTTQGFLPPRLTYAQKMAITNPATGLVVFCTDCGPPNIGGELEVYSGGIWRNMIGGAALGVASNTPSVTIGTQVWTNKNLDVSTYRNGDIIPQITDATTWANLTTGAWCYYNNDSTLDGKYGKLYNWYAVNDPRGLTPSGWHVPSNSEWATLDTYLGGHTVAGAKMKESGTLNWISPNTGATNESGFSGLPGANRYPNDGLFQNVGVVGYWWSASESNTTEAWSRGLFNSDSELHGFSSTKGFGLSVRCVRN